MAEGDAWRPVLAVLANPDARRVLAELMLGAQPDAAGARLSPSRRSHVAEMLRKAGLVGADGCLDESVFARVLRDASRPARTGVERFLTAEGRVDRYPAQASDLRELPSRIAHEVLAEGEVVGKREFTRRLSRHADDAVVLRRHLVDAALVERTRSGAPSMHFVPSEQR